MSTNRLNIVQIQTALLLPVTAQFVEQKLGIAPSEREKRAVYWKREDFTHICAALITHITAVRNADFDQISAERPKPAGKAAAAATAGDDPFGGMDTGSAGDDPFGGLAGNAEADDPFGGLAGNAEPDDPFSGMDTGSTEPATTEGFF